MRVLVNMQTSPLQMYLVKLSGEDLINEVRSLIGQREHSKAIMKILSKGIIEWQPGEDDMPNSRVDVMLSRKNAHWDLTK